MNNDQNGELPPLIIAGYSSKALAEKIADSLHTRVVATAHKQYDDGETEEALGENIRGRDIVVVASAAGLPAKEIDETKSWLRAAHSSGATHITLVVPYMWYGRSDKTVAQRQSPKLFQTIEELRAMCDSVVVADPHNHEVTYAKFNDSAGRSRQSTIAHFAFPYAVQLRDMAHNGYIKKSKTLFAHADAGSVKRIGWDFRECMYTLLGFLRRDPFQDDWAQGFKDRNKKTNKLTIKDFTGDVKGRDVVIFEDMVSSGGTAAETAALLKKKGARSVILFATSGLFTVKEGQPETAAVERIDNSALDAVFITDTYSLEPTRPAVYEAIQQSPIIHTIETAPYLALILQAMHAKAKDPVTAENSVSAILMGKHPEELAENQIIARATPLKEGNPLRVKSAIERLTQRRPFIAVAHQVVGKRKLIYPMVGKAVGSIRAAMKSAKRLTKGDATMRPAIFTIDPEAAREAKLRPRQAPFTTSSHADVYSCHVR